MTQNEPLTSRGPSGSLALGQLPALPSLVHFFWYILSTFCYIKLLMKEQDELCFFLHYITYIFFQFNKLYCLSSLTCVVCVWFLTHKCYIFKLLHILCDTRSLSQRCPSLSSHTITQKTISSNQLFLLPYLLTKSATEASRFPVYINWIRKNVSDHTRLAAYVIHM